MWCARVGERMLEAAALQRRRIMPLFIVLIVGACAPLIAEFSLEAYKNATTLKAETAALIDKAGEPYSAHAEEVAALTTKMNVAYEFAAGLPSNQLSAQQWQIMRDPNRNLYGGFVSLWKDQGTLSAAFRREKKTQISRAFDYIICLEANKKETTPCPAAASQ
jgi:hypothetical protein